MPGQDRHGKPTRLAVNGAVIFKGWNTRPFRLQSRSGCAVVVFREDGALNQVECWGDDIPDGEVAAFPGSSPD
ncbi:MAG: DUF1428 family protein [Gammaproteobacteria bacterium]